MLGDRSNVTTYRKVGCITHLASFEIAGLNPRWDFGYDENLDRYLYAFIIKPDGTGLYYDF